MPIQRSIYLTAQAAVARALFWRDKRVFYKLGKGGVDPAAAAPTQDWNSKPACDCSGFVNWCIGLSRFQPDDPFYVTGWGGWVFTDAMVADGGADGGLFDMRVGPVQPGDVIVYKHMRGKGDYGHTGIIVSVKNGKPSEVAHCASAHPVGRAVQVTPPDRFFMRGGIVLAPRKFTLSGAG